MYAVFGKTLWSYGKHITTLRDFAITCQALSACPISGQLRVGLPPAAEDWGLTRLLAFRGASSRKWTEGQSASDLLVVQQCVGTSQRGIIVHVTTPSPLSQARAL
jgi:hypothetical protein